MHFSPTDIWEDCHDQKPASVLPWKSLVLSQLHLPSRARSPRASLTTHCVAQRVEARVHRRRLTGVALTSMLLTVVMRGHTR